MTNHISSVENLSPDRQRVTAFRDGSLYNKEGSRKEYFKSEVKFYIYLF
jgi:hypothetical protein